MRYFRSAAFKRAYQSLDPIRRGRTDKALQQLAIMYVEGQRPFGLGLKAQIRQRTNKPLTGATFFKFKIFFVLIILTISII